ncbi:LuxR C-terminal-related transcriptional regulator [Actinoplanes sp. KI2]|uniref:ATP-binding protein n=1 Tax=Actinoplanes sp. KI2 TaxID=2983315 RepID=UPI0021D5A324|nr:LuxR C-terminal-related transcriptional regulator [Actinoplanes sp. KI2]MCU7725535.1 LuxR C-terminal-related transcriptional regulator [Actinoplanes sp. KI2]
MTESARPGNLPAELSSFVDRVGERQELKRLLTAARLVTVTGVGGVGKTRTVLRVAAEVRRAFADGAWLVDLSALGQADLVPEAVAGALGLRDQSTRSLVKILAEFLEARRLLLVLDNCEHLAQPCAQLVDALLRSAPGLRVLATSRQPLAVQGEHLFPLLPLPISPDGSRASGDRDAAVVLFAERARAASPTFRLTEHNQDAVARLCRDLDGIPLAIELAAVRTRALPVQQIAALLEGRLADRFALLGGGGAVAGRHESLRTAIDWSHGLCTREESLLWARVSVFAGDFDLTAAQEVCADDRLADEGVLHLVTSLVDKSILLAEEQPSGIRFRLLETIREYGLGLLRATGDERLLRRRHRDYYLGMARRFDDQWCGPEQVVWYQRLSREHANLRAALEFSLSDPAEHEAGLNLVAALLFFWVACGHPREGRHYLDRVLALKHPSGPTLAKAWWVCGWICAMQGDMTASERRLAESRQHADTPALAWISYVSGMIALLQGNPIRALVLSEESERLHRASGDSGIGLLVALTAQCWALAFAGEFDREFAAIEQTWALSDDHQERWMRSYADYMRALAEMGRGNPGVAVSYCRDALRFKRQLGDSTGCAMAVDVLATAAAALGEAERAAGLLGIAHRAWETVGLPQLGSPDLVAARAAVEKQARDKAGDRAFDAAYAAGLDLDLGAGIEYALGEPDRTGPPEVTQRAGNWAPLTRREREVAALVAEGLTNQQIAGRLLIGRRTANTHIEHILTKLDFTSRAQIAAWVAAQQRET